MKVSVVIEVNNQKVDQPYTYLVDFSMRKYIKVGSRVKVPFGNRTVEGFVLGVDYNDSSDDTLKYITEVYDDSLNEEQLSLIYFLRNHNPATFIECINTLLPSSYRANIKSAHKIKYYRYLKIGNVACKISEKEKVVIDYFKIHKEVLLSECNKLFSQYTVKKLRNNGTLIEFEKEVARSTIVPESQKMYESLNNEQQKVVDNVYNSESLYHLLFGPTGSGKTVCYLELIKKTLLDNRNVLILVPEISLTTQFVNVLSYHLQENLAVFHSKMSRDERNDQFRLVNSKKVKVAIGTRSSVFLPFDNLGLIIMDEEHDDSYIQEAKVSYSTREIAMLRSKYHNAKLLMGSATPSVSTYYLATEKNILLHTLSRKYSDSKTQTKIVDMKSNFDWILSKELILQIKEVINKNQQFIIMINRRGYANYLICNECGAALKCPKCDVTLTLHASNLLKCHHCTYETKEMVCKCGSIDLGEYGYGIQKVEEMLNEMVENVKVARIDTDVISSNKTSAKIFSDFTNHEYDGIVGTQLVSKGLNFLNVALVAIIDADYMLNINSYKSSEKTFQYINQSLGRNARGNDIEGVNLIQTYDTTHYSFVCAINNDYNLFYKNEISFREKLNYPPFVKYTKVFASSYNLSTLVKIMNLMYLDLKKIELSVSKPQLCEIEQINGQYRMQILVKHSKNAQLFGIINRIREYNVDENINIIVNFNPVNF